jgi:hypothetical protein
MVEVEAAEDMVAEAAEDMVAEAAVMATNCL